jgi:hypothetical protein
MDLINCSISFVRRPAGVTLATVLILGSSVIFSSCGGSTQARQTIVPPANIGDQQVEKTLKYDSRVQDFDTDGDKLVVNVNQFFITSPVGIQQRTLDGWFKQWRTEHGGDQKASASVSVEVKYDGNTISRATPSNGVEILAKPTSKTQDAE